MMRMAAFALAALMLTGCAGLFADHFYDAVTPSGVHCSDMPVVPSGSAVDREFHRLKPVKSGWDAVTETERIESIRRKACAVGADGVIETVADEHRDPKTGMFVTLIDGVSFRFLRPKRVEDDQNMPLTVARPQFQSSKPAPRPRISVPSLPPPFDGGGRP
jgi:hypothetical protein